MYPGRRVLVALTLCVAMSRTVVGGGGGCKYSVDSYATTDAMIVSEAAFIVQVSAADCERPPSGLYAAVDGKLVAAANTGPSEYQITWSDDFSTARRRDYLVDLFDEAGYGRLRKLLHEGDSSVGDVKPVHSAYVHYSGVYRGVWVKPEFLAAVVGIVILYVAYSFKSKIVS